MFKILSVFILMIFQAFSVLAAMDKPESVLSVVAEVAEVMAPQEAYYCQDERMGVEFLCDPDWIMEENEDGTAIILISSEPEVTLTLIKEDSAVITLKDLTWPVLQEMGQYQDEAAFNYVTVTNREAVNVEAIALADDEIRLSDFYVTRDGVLYSFLFAVKPKEVFAQFVPTIFNIVSSITFLDEVKSE